jgi:hypothetical protein
MVNVFDILFPLLATVSVIDKISPRVTLSGKSLIDCTDKSGRAFAEKATEIAKSNNRIEIVNIKIVVLNRFILPSNKAIKYNR